jgi:hypothetical protein
VPPSQMGGPGRKKSATQILPALVGGQACLTHRNSHALQQTRFEMQPPLGMAAPHLDNRGTGKQLGMVKATLPLLAGVHRHRDHQHWLRRNKGFEAIGQERAQTAGYRLHTVVLEQVNHLAKLALVAAIGYRFHESRRGQAAGLTKGRRIVIRQWRKIGNAQVFPATSAEDAGLRRKLRTAEVADWDTGQTQERAATKGTGAGEQGTGKAIRWTSKHANNSAPNRSLRQRDVESQG